MIGVILAGGTGSRLYPHTKVTNKHLLPVGNVPMVAHPFKYLLNAGISDFFIVTGGEHFASVARLFGSGKKTCEILGFGGKINSISFGVQDGPGGIAEALGLAKRYAGNDPVVVVLGDNIFEDDYFLKSAVNNFKSGGHIFLKEVSEDQLFETGHHQGLRRARFGVAELEGNKVINIEEKPEKPKSRYVVTGAYIYDSRVFSVIPQLKPSGRNELEITDVNNYFIKLGEMQASMVNGWWTDAGTLDTYQLANKLVHKKEIRK